MGLIDKVCCVFPGQGSQFVGMGKDLYSKNKEIVEKIFHTGNEILGYDITNLIINNPEETLINNPEETLKKTIYCQSGILLINLAFLEVLNKIKEILCSLTLGHSVGEYAALVASKALSLEDALKLVKTRAELMSKCIPNEKVEEDTSHMAAVLTENHGLVYNTCKIYSSPGNTVELAIENSESQKVISGNNNAVIKAVKHLRSKGIKVIYLPVEGPFHSELMRPAAEEMKKTLENKIKEPTIQYIANSTGKVIYKPKEIEESSVKQIYQTVKWKQSLETAIKMATEKKIKTFIECGPGDVQTKLLKRNPLYKDITVLNVKDYINQNHLLN